MLARIVIEQLAHITAHDGRGHDHFRVQKRIRRVQPVQVTAMAIRPIHHGRNAEPAVYVIGRFHAGEFSGCRRQNYKKIDCRFLTGGSSDITRSNMCRLHVIYNNGTSAAIRSSCSCRRSARAWINPLLLKGGCSLRFFLKNRYSETWISTSAQCPSVRCGNVSRLLEAPFRASSADAGRNRQGVAASRRGRRNFGS